MLISKNALISSKHTAAGDQPVISVVKIDYWEYDGSREQTKTIKV